MNIIGFASTDQDDVLFVEVEPHTTVALLKQRIEFQSAIPPAKQVIQYNGLMLLDDSKTMEQCQVTADSMLGVHSVSQQPRAQEGARPGSSLASQPRRAQSSQAASSDPEVLRQQYLQNPPYLAQLRYQIPQLADVINDPPRWRELYNEYQRRRAELEAQKERDIALLQADPFDVEAQKRIEEMIRLEQVDENLEQTREHHPEGEGFHPIFSFTAKDMF